MLQNFVELFRTKFGLYGLPKLTDDAVALLLPGLLSAHFSEHDLAEYTKPTEISEYTQQRIDFLSLVERIRIQRLAKPFLQSTKEIIDHLGRFHPELYYAIETYVRTYAWVSVSHHVQPMTLDQALTDLQEVLRDATAMRELRHLRSIRAHLSHKRRTNVFRNLSKRDQDILRFLQQMNRLNESRKAAMCKAILWSYPLFQAIADRFSIDTISLRQLTAHEIVGAINVGRLSTRLRNEIKQRLATFVCFSSSEETISASGPRATTIIRKALEKTDYDGIREIHGNVAHAGKARGNVRRILSEHQIERLKKGEILVTSMTDPNMVPAMKKAAAIVTDEGGITCHAAIVSRELGVPCIIGTKIATKVFKDGDKVEVDAKKGIVRKI